MSNLVMHAKRELDLAGNDEDFNDSVIKMVEVFASHGHSGSSAFCAIEIVYDLLRFRNLTPLTDDPLEWVDVGNDMWQNLRNPEAISTDGGKTYRLNSEAQPTHESMRHGT